MLGSNNYETTIRQELDLYNILHFMWPNLVMSSLYKASTIECNDNKLLCSCHVPMLANTHSEKLSKTFPISQARSLKTSMLLATIP